MFYIVNKHCLTENMNKIIDFLFKINLFNDFCENDAEVALIK